MAERIDVGVTIKGTEKVSSDLTKIDNKTQDLGGNVDAATGALDRMTGGAISSFKSIGSGIKKGILGMKSFKIALASTGIGLLVIAVGSLVAYFTQTQKGAEKLEIAMAGVKIIFAKLTDVASTLGEKILWVFTEPEQAIKDLWGTIKTYFIDKFHEVVKSVGLLGSAFVKLFAGDFSGALGDATEGAKGLFLELTPLGVVIETVGAIVENVTPLIGEFVNEVNDAVDAATKLSNRSIQLRKDQRDLALGFAEGRAQIKEYNLVAEDVTQTLEDRLVAAQKAIDIEKALMTERQRLAQEEVDIQKANMALSKNTEADQQKLVDLEVALINIRTESAEMQTTLGNKLNIINAQAAAEKATQMKTFLDGLETMGKAEEEATLLRLKNLKVVADAEKATAMAVRAARLGIVAAGFDALKSMAKTEEGQKRLAISQILVNQAIAMSEAIRSAQQSATATGPLAVFTAPGFTASMIAMVLGSFASIKGVMNQAGASSGSVGTSSGGGSSAGMQLGLTPNLEGVTEVQEAMPPVKAFVVQSQLADESALVAQLKAMASL
tara:strand:- start:187 stop:1845 length:1659 start_codon:yes stop_codon:yes gene_type:complete